MDLFTERGANRIDKSVHRSWAKWTESNELRFDFLQRFRTHENDPSS